MPEFSAERPHAITCIKRSVRDLLKQNCGDDLTVSCDRDDCWTDSELFKWRQAVNITTQNDTIGEQHRPIRQNKRLTDLKTEADRECTYEAILNLDIQIYVEQCDCDPDYDDDCDCFNAVEKAYAILAHITHVLTAYQSQVLGRRVRYTGSFKTTTSDNELDIAVVSGSFEIHYLFDMTKPWVVRQ